MARHTEELLLNTPTFCGDEAIRYRVGPRHHQSLSQAIFGYSSTEDAMRRKAHTTFVVKGKNQESYFLGSLII